MATVERAVVVALHEVHVVAHQERTDEADDEPRTEVADVRVAPNDDVAVRREHRSPQRVALAAEVVEVGEHLLGAHHPSACICRDLRRPVDRAVVDHEDLVDEWAPLHELVLDQLDDLADRVLLVAPGKHTEIVVSRLASTRRGRSNAR